MRDLVIQISYLTASVLFILGLRSLTRPDRARRGMQLAAAGMAFAIVGTLINHQIVDYRWIAAGLVLGVIIGYPMGMWVPMTAMPQRIALSLAFSALAATLVGIAEYYTRVNAGEALPRPIMTAIAFEVLLGTVTVGGTLVAAGKLQEVITSRPLTYRGQNLVNALLFAVMVGFFVLLIVHPDRQALFYALIALALLFGILLVLPIGGADMPVVISLLNAFTGLAAAATGFELENNVLIVSGMLVGASGTLLTILMGRAMNRSIANVLFGAFGQVTPQAAATAETDGGTVRSASAEDIAVMLAYAHKVVFIPGYGLAVAQAQHDVRQLADLLEQKGVEVSYAIHPVAGRMPGHMNVLLAEANVPYPQLEEMDDANAEFRRTDVAVVVGANDVVNPDARNNQGSPIYGMPILNVDQANAVVVLKRSMNPGFAGIENPLFYNPKTVMLFGDAKDSITKLIADVKSL